jgi:hypothetical protein
LGSILGPYEETAAERRKLIAKKREHEQAADERKANALGRRNAARDRAEAMGYPTRFMSDYDDFDEVHLTVEVFERMLTALERADEDADASYARGVEVGREAGQREAGA